MKHVKLFEQYISEKREDVGQYNTVKKVISKLGRRPSEQDLASFITNNYYDVTEVERGEDDPSANDKIADLVAFYKFDIEDWNIAWFDAQNESVVTEGKMPNKFIGNDEIVFLKTKEGSRGAHYNLYYKGHDIDFGGHTFGSEKELKDFADNCVLSDQWYKKLRYEDAKPLPESVVTEGYGEFIKAKNLTDIIKLSKENKKAIFYVTDDNNSRIGTFYLKNGKFAKATTANANYDLQNSKTSLKDRNDVIYKYKVDESVVTEAKNTIGLAFKDEDDYNDFKEFVAEQPRGAIRKNIGFDSKTKSWNVEMDVKVLDSIYGEGHPGNKKSGWYGGLPDDFESVIIESVEESVNEARAKYVNTQKTVDGNPLIYFNSVNTRDKWIDKNKSNVISVPNSTVISSDQGRVVGTSRGPYYLIVKTDALEESVTEARAYKLKASEFGGDTFSAAYNVKGETTWRVHSTYAIDQVSGENDASERDVVFFEAMPINDEIYIKIGGINNLKRTGATVGNNFGTTIEEWKNDPEGIAKEASEFLTDATHLKWINKKARSQGQVIKWALKDDYSSVIIDLVNKSLGLKESVVTEAKDMTFVDYLEILDQKFEDAQNAVKGNNGTDAAIEPTRGDILQNFTLFRNYVSSLTKKYKGDKTKLRFITERESVFNETFESVFEHLTINEEKIKYAKGKTYQSSGHWTVMVDSNSSMCDIRVNSSAGWRLDPHDDREETWELLDGGRQRATIYFRRGSIDKFAQQMFDLNDRTTWGNKTLLTAKDYADIIRVWIDMKKANESVNESFKIGKVIAIRKYNPKTNSKELVDVRITDYIKKPGSKDFVEYEIKGKKRKVSIDVFKSIMESVNESKDEVTPEQLANLQKDIKKINKKIKVYISTHPVTKGELAIELGADHDNDDEIDQIYSLLKKHTGDHKTGSMFAESVVTEGAVDVTPESDVTVDNYTTDNGEEIAAVEIVGAIVSSQTEDEFLEYFYDVYGQGAFTETDTGTLVKYYNEYLEEVTAKETEEEEEAEKEEEGGDDDLDLDI